MTKLQKLRLSSLMLLAFFVASVGFHYWHFAYEGLGYPHSTYLYQPHDGGLADVLGMQTASQISSLHCFGDFFLTWVQNIERDPYSATSIIRSNYFPFAHAITLPLTFQSYALSITLFLLLVVATALVFSWYHFRDYRTDRWENAKLVITFAFLSYPFQMIADRGNIEVLVFLLVWGGLRFFRERSYLSALLLAAATAMKGYPGLLLGLFIFDRHYRAFALAVFFSVVLNLAGLCIFKGGFWVNWNLLQDAARTYTSIVTQDASRNSQHCSGWLALVDGLSTLFPSAFDAESGTFGLITRNYSSIRWLLLAYFVAPLIGIRRLELWQIAASLTFAMIVIPPAAYDYRLSLVLVPFALFVASHKRRKEDLAYVILFSLLFVPKQFAIIKADVGIGTVINTPIMLIMTGIILWDLLSKCELLQRIPPQLRSGAGSPG